MSVLKIKRVVTGPVRTNCYIVYNEENKEALIFDPATESNEISDFITTQSLKVKGIFLTHGHFDHIGGAKKFRNLYDTQVYCHEDEKEVAESLTLNLSMTFGDNVAIVSDVVLRDRQTISLCGFCIEVIHTPGHTQGSCCYLISIGEEKILISGDTIFAGSYGRTDFPTGSMAKLKNSIVERILCLDDDLKIYPGHDMDTTVADEKPLWRLS